MTKKKTDKESISASLDEVVQLDKERELQKLASRIKEFRLTQHSNYEDFANKHRIGRSQYFRYEHGEDLRYFTLLRVIRGLGITPREFFSEGFDWD